jgi:hypothetical protein
VLLGATDSEADVVITILLGLALDEGLLQAVG